MNTQSASPTFSARVEILGINPRVMVPEKTVAALLRMTAPRFRITERR
jgi:hypothetical protein